MNRSFVAISILEIICAALRTEGGWVIYKIILDKMIF